MVIGWNVIHDDAEKQHVTAVLSVVAIQSSFVFVFFNNCQPLTCLSCPILGQIHPNSTNDWLWFVSCVIAVCLFLWLMWRNQSHLRQPVSLLLNSETYCWFHVSFSTVWIFTGGAFSSVNASGFNILALNTFQLHLSVCYDAIGF